MKLHACSCALVGLAVALVLLTATSTASQEVADASAASLREPKIFFGGVYSTLTRVSVSLTTTGTRYFTCITAINNLLTCTGRRRRRNIVQDAVPIALPEANEEVPVVHSSLSAAPESGVQTGSEVRDAKGLFLTIFTTTTSSVTLSTYFSDTGTTVSISVGCFDPSFSFPPSC